MKRLVALCACSLSAFIPASVAAEEPADPGLIGEVIVTATYPATELMDTPLAISAVTDAMVENPGAPTMEDVFTLVPGLNMVSGGYGGIGEARYTVRGITSQSGDIGYAPIGANSTSMRRSPATGPSSRPMARRACW